MPAEHKRYRYGNTSGTGQIKLYCRFAVFMMVGPFLPLVENWLKRCAYYMFMIKVSVPVFKNISISGRMDTIQPTVDLAKQSLYAEELEKHRQIAKKYTNYVSENVKTPPMKSDRTSFWGQFSIRNKQSDSTQLGLKDKGLPSSKHYLMPLRLQECFQYLGLRVGGYPE